MIVSFLIEWFMKLLKTIPTFLMGVFIQFYDYFEIQAQINNNTVRILDVVSQDLGVFVHNNPQAEAHKRYTCFLSVFCLRVLLNENPQNLEKMTPVLLSVLLIIYGFGYKSTKPIEKLRRHSINSFDCSKILG